MALDRFFIRPANDQDLLGLLSIKPDELLHRDRLSRQEAGTVSYLAAGDVSHPILGYVLLKWPGSLQVEAYPVLEDLIVRAEFRGLGIGTRLISHAEHLCRGHGLAQIGLGVNPTANPRAHALYERLGYCDTGAPPQYDVYAHTDETGQRRFYEDWCIQMVKDLST